MTDWTEREIDALIDGKTVSRGDLTRLVPLVEQIRMADVDGANSARAGDILARVAAEAARATPSSGAATAPARAATHPWRRRAVISISSAVGAGVVFAGAAAAADGAAPGDILYDVDRAFEAVGIGDGGTPERLTEAIVLEGRGRSAEALAHAAHALSDEGDELTAGELSEAADRVTGGGVGGDVAAMLELIGQSDVHGKDFGQSVAVLAREIGAKPDHAGPPATDQEPSPTPGVDEAPGNSGGKGNSGNGGSDKGKSGETSPGKSGNDSGKSGKKK